MRSINSLKFQRSITQELETVKDRVRDIIGDRNWPEEGRYKEAILVKAIQSQLPSHISIGTGFIVREIDDQQISSSKQHDLILYDNRKPLILGYGDFIVATPSNVLGVIEVKSNLTPTTFSKAFKKLETSLAKLIDDPNSVFIGLFSFSFTGTIDNKTVVDVLRKSKKIINHISLGETYFVRYWMSHQGELLTPKVQTIHDFYNTYALQSLSYSYFISNILHRTVPDIDDRYFHSFPIAGTKEVMRCETIEIK